jgi:hypothetical protein
MGFFSWMTQDTDKSIANNYSKRKPFSVTMTDDKGMRWTETNYEGYGDFGGKDYYELLDQMNGGSGDRSEGIRKAFADGYGNGKNPNVKHPNLSEDPNWEWRNEIPNSCPDQGYFYDDNDNDDEWN